MSQSHKTIALVIGAAVATGTLVAGSLFTMQAMAGGYQQDPAKAEAKAGEGNCGGMQPAAGAPAHTLASMDTDKDGRLSRAEFDAAHKGSEEKFAGHDGNGDGFITQAEMDAHHAQMKDAKHDAASKGGEGKCGEGKCGEGKCGGNP